ncbi:MAG: NAD(P)/FAD-dependent oxidoreductase [Paracoccaceae bacterium]
MTSGTIGIVGAGVAGLACATRLAEAGRRVSVIEKSKGLGGRLATRRAEVGAFDHGPPGFTAADPGFRAAVEHAVAAGAAAPWPGGEAVVLSGPPGEAFVGLPGASGFARGFLGGAPVEVRFASEARALARSGAGWRVEADGIEAEAFDALVLAVPAPQARRLLDADSDAYAATATAGLDAVAYRPVMTAMLALDGTLPAGVERRVRDHPVLAKAIRQSALPGRDGPGERWVIHAAADWSRANLDTEKPAIADALVAAFAEAVGDLPGETYRAGHRWRYALTETPLGRPCLWDADRRLGLCGDWCLGDGVEHAWCSGVAMAEAVLAHPA